MIDYRQLIAGGILLMATTAQAEPALAPLPMQLHVEASGEVEPDMAVTVREVEAPGPDSASATAALNRKLQEAAGRLR
jgi:uncharacterized protein YggE